jgi:hypothetical protein
VVQLFAPDGIFELLASDAHRKTYRGHDEIRVFLKESLIPGVLFPMIHNHIIEVDGDEAESTCAMEARTLLPHMPIFAGYYHDRLHDFGGHWLFTERRFFLYLPQFERSGLDCLNRQQLASPRNAMS